MGLVEDTQLKEIGKRAILADQLQNIAEKARAEGANAALTQYAADMAYNNTISPTPESGLYRQNLTPGGREFFAPRYMARPTGPLAPASQDVQAYAAYLANKQAIPTGLAAVATPAR